ncbi:F0F1 ATP synthase subunit gamma [Paraburkholderia ferrariae]|uniref:F0F1 ATP synthase subunit gamma n=1 Tax=Paraburkholderia ferrariae TaxID=386056 RepID=UPI0004809630|nr:FoF1 ATP synthase subunit gamma [Paraburkholderia ferrariae]
MSGKLGEIEARIAATDQLDAVVGAMRGIAASRSREAQGRLPGIRAAAAAAAGAIAEVLAFAPANASPRSPDAGQGTEVCVVVGTEQGFVGGLNDQIAAQALSDAARETARARQWLLVGTRLTSAFAGRGVAPAWSAPMAPHSSVVPRLAARVSDALYARLADGGHATRVSVLHALAGEPSLRIVRRTLIPFDFARFHVSPRTQPPLVNLPPAPLLAGLVEFYVYTELCEALMLAFAAENEARVRAMLAARTHVQQRLGGLEQQYRALRQDEITAEIVELTTGREAAGIAGD